MSPYSYIVCCYGPSYYRTWSLLIGKLLLVLCSSLSYYFLEYIQYIGYSGLLVVIHSPWVVPRLCCLVDNLLHTVVLRICQVWASRLLLGVHAIIIYVCSGLYPIAIYN